MADDHGLFRVGLASALDDYHDIAVLGQASRGSMAVRLVAELRPDVVLLDQEMPDLDGEETIRAILAENPLIRVVVLTANADETAIRAAIDAGATGVVFKDSPIDHIVSAVRAAASGASWLDGPAAETLLGTLRRLHSSRGTFVPSTDDFLSRRETEVLRLLTLGLDNKEIADMLSISPRTAKNHVANILSKLGLSNRIQAAVYAVRRGLV
jgi:DNA-binding NarL/FixJ family response regulator